jgi:hypothetical protein
MPNFETYVDVDADDFYKECNRREKKELIDLISSECEDDSDLKDYLIESIGYESDEEMGSMSSNGRETFDHLLFKKSLLALDKQYHCLPNELVEQVNKLAEKFRI